MSDSLQDRISAYLNGDLTDAELAALHDELATDPAALTEFVLALDQHAELRKAFLEKGGARQALTDMRRPRARLAFGTIAACAVAVVTALLLRSTPVARLDSLVGQVRLSSGTAAVEGQEILDGQGLETVGDSRATLKLPDGTTLRLNARTRIAELTADHRVVLHQGALAADVRPRERPLIFSTPHGDATVLGTSLRLAVDGTSTRLEVSTGRVRLNTLEVAAGQYAVAGAGATLAAKPLRAERGVELVRRMPPNSWLAVPDSRLRQALPDPVLFPKLRDPRGIVESWSGGLLDPRRGRLVLWGGGHTNYHGNELYAFDLDALTWERLTDPTPEPVLGRQVNADGTPMARATYNGLAYIAHADRMFALGGDTADSAGPRPDSTWTFDFAARAWRNREPSGDRPPTWVGATCAYDPATSTVWWGEGRTPAEAGLYSYDHDANRWTRHTGDFFYYQTSAIDLRRGLLVAVGDGKLFAHDVRGGDPARRTWTASGGDAFIARLNPGWDYDAAADRFVGWAGGAVYVLNPETRRFKSYDAPGAPAATPNGIFGRWRYVPALDVFVVVTGIDEDVHFYKPPVGD
jgi:ferric-dicitrate binding protein FerR (iron transport regulator)